MRAVPVCPKAYSASLRMCDPASSCWCCNDVVEDDVDLACRVKRRGHGSHSAECSYNAGNIAHVFCIGYLLPAASRMRLSSGPSISLLFSKWFWLGSQPLETKALDSRPAKCRVYCLCATTIAFKHTGACRSRHRTRRCQSLVQSLRL